MNSIAILSGIWKNLLSSNINSANLGDRVLLSVGGRNLDGENITYSIYKKNLFFDSLEYSVNLAVTTIDYKLISSGTYYFIAEVKGTPYTSEDLTVSGSASGGSPAAVISSPEGNEGYLINTPIEFNQTSYDSNENIVGYNWNFGDGTTSTAENPTHVYSNKGEEKVTLTVIDENGIKSTTQISLFIVTPGINTVPVIESPSEGMVIVTDCSSFNPNCLRVDYNGLQSYVINITSSGSIISSVVCLAGKCPGQMGDGFPITNAPLNDYSSMFYNWTFGSEGLSPDQGVGKTFGSKGFASTGNKNVNLNVAYSSQNSKLLRNFMLLDQRQCSNDGATWYNVSGGAVIEQHGTMSGNACAGVDGKIGSVDDCCPVGFVCSNSGCVGDGDGTKLCEDYTDKSTCNNDTGRRAENEILLTYNPECGKTVDGENILCGCQWQDGVGTCNFTKFKRDSNTLTISMGCIYSTTMAACNNGYQTVTISTRGAEAWCTADNNKQAILPCGKPVIELSFFTILQAVIAIMIVVGIYFVLRVPEKSIKGKRHVFK